MRDKFFNVGIKAAVLFTKGLHCMHWHARVARSVVLALTLLIMTTQTTQYVCVSCEQRGTFTSALPTIRAARTHIGRSRTCCRLGHPRNYAGDEADRTHGGRLRRSRPSARLAAPTAGFDPFL